MTGLMKRSRREERRTDKMAIPEVRETVLAEVPAAEVQAVLAAVVPAAVAVPVVPEVPLPVTAEMAPGLKNQKQRKSRGSREWLLFLQSQGSKSLLSQESLSVLKIQGPEAAGMRIQNPFMGR